MTDQQPPRPGPTANPETAWYWEGLADGVLRLQRCGGCRAAQHYPRRRCRSCWSDDLAWEDAAGLATVWTWTIVHRPGHPAWRAEAPYAVVVVELVEGPRLVTRWGGGLDELRIGMPVRVGAMSQDGSWVAVARPEEAS